MTFIKPILSTKSMKYNNFFVRIFNWLGQIFVDDGSDDPESKEFIIKE
jgi:hypothetical protein